MSTEWLLLAIAGQLCVIAFVLGLIYGKMR